MITAKADARFRHLGRKTALFILAPLLMVAGVLFFIGREQDLFTKKYELQFTVDKGTGFSKGMPVKLSGFRIGRVSAIALNDEARVNVALQIDQRYKKWIRGDSRAKLIKEGLVGDMIIDISVGSSSLVLDDHSVISFEKTKGLDELADDLAEKVKPVLAQMKEIIEYVNDPQGDLKQSIRNINQLTGRLDGTITKSDDLLSTGRETVVKTADRVNLLLSDADRRLNEITPLLERFDHTMSVIENSTPSLLEKIDGTLVNLLEISRSASAETSRIMPRVPVIIDKAEDAIDKGNRLINGVSDIWPVRSAIPAPVEQRLVPGDSHE